MGKEYVQGKFYSAVNALIGAESLGKRLIVAFNILHRIEATDLEGETLVEFKQLFDLVTRDVSFESSIQNMSESDQIDIAEKLFKMYDNLMRTFKC